MCMLNKHSEKQKTIVPFIYKGYRLHPVSSEYKDQYVSFLRQFYRENNSVDYLSDNIDPHMSYITQKYRDKENRGFFVFKDGELVGDLFITRLGCLGSAFVGTIGLLKDHQGKGVGRGLMEVAETLARDSSSKSIELMVEPNNGNVVDFYKKLGYVVRRKSDDGWNMIKYLTVRGKGQGHVKPFNPEPVYLTK